MRKKELLYGEREREIFDTPPANLEPAAEAVEVGRLILKAAEWSPQSHELFPEAARKRAVEVMRLGYLIAWDEERFEGREGAAPELADIWRGFVLPRVVGGALRRRESLRRLPWDSSKKNFVILRRECARVQKWAKTGCFWSSVKISEDLTGGFSPNLAQLIQHGS
ncbi:hypothetical protein EMIHUDRAFT_218517 [Emiliania huxleyi CCMP1516]|uniref:Uncharacterized protein n=2 Tax=Emiliania huxleyi TaxID=2903 RepID=A0A0D3I8F2_EMIH1|nr:hypothetical protein EMIHUDRAFT_218517 [Emiliania huxleyi CCMP1516]EOD07537.1 hypothetical protein EMIHUDRAFT_218517 [Emiliania huxleyi CCMP1516]|eukprot:XP_005759966.1 hypothetical protein EMIHUDRAFT_218517 [Emiliania huxleyi CCMP1516]